MAELEKILYGLVRVGTVTDREMEREVLRGGGDSCLNRLLEIAKGQGAPDNVTAVLLRQQ